MSRALPPHRPIREEDLEAFKHLIPRTAAHLLALLGTHDALKLFNGWAGVQVVVPKGPCNNADGAQRWAQIVAIIGETAMIKLADDMGGMLLEVPTLPRLREARRNHAIRAEFDRLTARPPAGEGMSKAAAVQALGIAYTPITYRQLEIILDRAE